MSAGDAYLRCRSCSAVLPLAGTSPIAPCPECGKDTLVAIVEVRRIDPLDVALRKLSEHVALPHSGRRLVPDAGSPARVRADARNRAMMASIIACAVEAVIDVPDEAHVCTCDHTEGCDGCSTEWFASRCRFEAALRKLVALDADVPGGYDAGQAGERASGRESEMERNDDVRPAAEGQEFEALREEDVREADVLDDRVVEEELPGDTTE